MKKQVLTNILIGMIGILFLFTACESQAEREARLKEENAKLKEEIAKKASASLIDSTGIAFIDLTMDCGCGGSETPKDAPKKIKDAVVKFKKDHPEIKVISWNPQFLPQSSYNELMGVWINYEFRESNKDLENIIWTLKAPKSISIPPGGSVWKTLGIKDEEEIIAFAKANDITFKRENGKLNVLVHPGDSFESRVSRIWFKRN